MVDEVEKTGNVNSTQGARHTLTDALLPLLERMTAATWECPFYQIRFDMSWANWVLTANSRRGLPEPLQSRCVVLDLPDLTRVQLRDLALTEGERRGLSGASLSALDGVFEHGMLADYSLSLRTVSRMLDRAETLSTRPGTVIYDWRHYLAVIQRKPGALRNGAPFTEMPDIQAPIICPVWWQKTYLELRD